VIHRCHIGTATKQPLSVAANILTGMALKKIGGGETEV
jgi:hypothetical protein